MWICRCRKAHAEGVPRLRIIHHDPGRTDEDLDRESEELRTVEKDYDFAREGEVIEL